MRVYPIIALADTLLANQQNSPRIWSSAILGGLPYDWLSQDIFESIYDVQEAATKWLWTYNNERPNMALGGVTPMMKLATAA